MKMLVKSPLYMGLCYAFAHAQPDNPPIAGDAPCLEAEAMNPSDTVASGIDAEGYYSLFNGRDFTGWWQSCRTMHSSGSAEGAIFRVDTLRKAIYSTQRGSGPAAVGGILMTNKIFDHYELVFDLWPDFGNDGGIFNRTPNTGRCYKTYLSYVGGQSMGGAWGEGGFPSRDLRPFYFLGSEDAISVVGSTFNSHAWDSLTGKRYSPDFGCDPKGCKPEDWVRLWDVDGWNQFKIQFYGGLEGKDAVRAKTWFRKAGASTWIPLMEDTTLVWPTPPGHIGLQVHGGGRFSGPKGTWYRNIRWRPLDVQGRPLPPASAIQQRRIGLSLDATLHVQPGHDRVSFLFRRPEAGRFIAVHDLDGRLVERLDGSGTRTTWSARQTARRLYLARIEGRESRGFHAFLLD
jgi:hypothetical protein